MMASVLLPLATLLLASQVACTSAGGSTPSPDYNEHLEIDFEDKDDTPPPWEEPEAREPGTLAPGVVEDLDWVPDAVRDVGYYLRQHKFNEHDRRDSRANTTDSTAAGAGQQRGFVGAFPTLRNLHWEVRDACEQGFLQCLRYLQDKLSVVRLRRADDTAKAMWDAKLPWPIGNASTAATTTTATTGDSAVFESVEDKVRHLNREQVLALDKTCSDLKADDEADYDGFLGPLDRFQWRTTASYYMCTFTMKAERALRHFGEPCDNWAWCLDWDVGPHNGDLRARDSEPFECARYSFCPDPCCPRRHASVPDDCVEGNPCRDATDTIEEEKEAAVRSRCSLAAGLNTDLRGMMTNRWNTTCQCPSPGRRWEARFGFCVDVDECEERNPCDGGRHEECVNTPGSFACRCRWGWRRGRSGRCVADPEARLAASARRGGADLPNDGRRRDAWELLEDVFVPAAS